MTALRMVLLQSLLSNPATGLLFNKNASLCEAFFYED